MSYNYMTHTLQAHDCLMELKGILQPYREHPQAAAWLADVERLDKKLENMHFQVAIVGEFKRGKTSLINALLRRRVLPADVVPTTATLNRITYGLKGTIYPHVDPIIDDEIQRYNKEHA